MNYRAFIRTCFFMLLFLAGSAMNLHAQTSQNQQRSMNIEMSRDFDQFFFVDETGLQISLAQFYESFLDVETYRLGPGDLLGLAFEGNMSGTIRGLRVNSQGSVMIPRVGVVHVDNLLFPDAEARINEKIDENLPDTRAKVVLEQPRTVQIHVVGNIPYTGPQLVFAQTRLDQAIYRSFFQPATTDEDTDDEFRSPQMTSANPLSPAFMLANKFPEEFIEQNRYSLRNITINRADGTTSHADLIRYFKTGELDANPIVREGDIISINRFHEYNPKVSLSGAVHKNLELEYREDDSVERLLRMAGGKTYDAEDNYIKVMRRTDDGLQEVILSDSSAIADYTVQPNDRLVIPYDREKRAGQSVTVFGEAKYTGRFPVEEGVTTLYDLMKLTGGLTDDALAGAAYMIRSMPAKTEFGEPTIMSGQHFEPRRPNQEQVRQQFIFEPRVQSDRSDFGSRPSFVPDALKRTSDQYVEGLEYLDMEARIVRNHVAIDLTDEEQMKEIKLFDGDRLQIPRKDGTVFVFGQVNQPGYYNFNPDYSSENYIEKAGGLALAAEEDRVFIIKARTHSWYQPGEASLEPGDLVFVDRKPAEELQASREYELRKQEQRNTRIQVYLSGIATAASVITAFVAITR